ncbi:alkyl sulfatase dimerization domain-containing protein [Noviherbaspirillum saxi]|uniref:MBL fold metallo-hydrolase n=1 Tax=Noviherbaspirillum saxi TaxID=2320863 RepID=A0A3A3FK13_9BURK|nr:alkyl sulfatase dimerization domain-containing protein [Noviherbaspirillum saxi]RJF95534.1 MBL fold metallo-hydrolase [Noviherbaspirillum saxi]
MTSEMDEGIPLVTGTGIEPIAAGVWLLRGQGQSFVAEIDEGLVVVDAGPGGRVTRGMIEHLRSVSTRPVVAICYSHGHVGYNVGVPLWRDDAVLRGHAMPTVIAHERVRTRYERYRTTLGLQERMAEIQFRMKPGGMRGKIALHDPDQTYAHQLVLGKGERRIHLIWAPSETDDVTAVWVPHSRVLYGSAAVIDSIPNIGTPFRTMRDTLRWASTLDHLRDLRPLRVVREFGPDIAGEDEVQQVLGVTAKALRWLHAEVVRMINEGMGERDILAAIRYPKHLFDVPWMRPSYGAPDYIVRDIYRSENGWWDRNPTSLHPASPENIGREVVQAIADKGALISHAQSLAAKGEFQLALHVIDILATATGDTPELIQARQLKAGWLRARADQVPSYVSRSLYKVSADMIEQDSAHTFGIR